ncbi:ParB/RepB/Spo0J family partition protein [Lysinibacillus fusiformis]|uniref:ParB/RepB/Spo0J family partition protein n=1 Tax=Lysinibacillus fusiformis TaxID=28031 RepID=UPI0004685B2D|nr:ParB N-terminal domain-containing protein [Lysinibacillus fusiformis]
MARTKWQKPAGDNFVADMRKVAQKAAEKTELQLKDIVEEDTGIRVQKIRLSDLHDAPNGWNVYRDIKEDKDLFERMRKSILNVGLLSPIIVWEREKGNGFYILMGHSRKRVFDYLYKEEGFEEYGEIFAFVRPHDSLTKAEAIGIITDSNISRGNLTEAERILETGLHIEAFEEEAQKIFVESGKYARLRDVIGEMIGRKDGKDVDNIRALCSLPREVLDLINTTPITKTHLLNVAVRNEEVQQLLINHKEKITKEFVAMLKPGLSVEDIRKALEENYIKPEPDTITITVPDGEGYRLTKVFSSILENEGIEDFKVKLKRKRKKTTD